MWRCGACTLEPGTCTRAPGPSKCPCAARTMHPRHALPHAHLPRRRVCYEYVCIDHCKVESSSRIFRDLASVKPMKPEVFFGMIKRPDLNCIESGFGDFSNTMMF